MHFFAHKLKRVIFYCGLSISTQLVRRTDARTSMQKYCVKTGNSPDERSIIASDLMTFNSQISLQPLFH